MKNPESEEQIDLALSVLCIITPAGVMWTMRDLAELCGCTRSKIEHIQHKAVKKFRRAAKVKNMQEFLQD